MKDWQPLPGWIQVEPLDSQDWEKPWKVVKVGEAVKGMSCVQAGDTVLLKPYGHPRFFAEGDGGLLFVNPEDIVAKLIGEE